MFGVNVKKIWLSFTHLAWLRVGLKQHANREIVLVSTMFSHSFISFLCHSFIVELTNVHAMQLMYIGTLQRNLKYVLGILCSNLLCSVAVVVTGDVSGSDGDGVHSTPLFDARSVLWHTHSNTYSHKHANMQTELYSPPSANCMVVTTNIKSTMCMCYIHSTLYIYGPCEQHLHNIKPTFKKMV